MTFSFLAAWVSESVHELQLVSRNADTGHCRHRLRRLFGVRATAKRLPFARPPALSPSGEESGWEATFAFRNFDSSPDLDECPFYSYLSEINEGRVVKTSILSPETNQCPKAIRCQCLRRVPIEGRKLSIGGWTGVRLAGSSRPVFIRQVRATRGARGTAHRRFRPIRWRTKRGGHKSRPAACRASRGRRWQPRWQRLHGLRARPVPP